ncbi:Hemin transport protein HmuS [Labilithrix luteola]|uniref:Hemin transport protein HmuS n=1 Tax=Labilithrix luteola TaxID=1391654 RepID=A0A0K1QBL7_9BACT|nr:ChuX/HutX family heme-like substrate-binding protein [Labilithrix luteola]AKV02800.1 Hemin transport protein HmuS [Labilithrix luteola]
MSTDVNLYEKWMALRASEKGLRGLELSNRLGVSECELYASAIGKTAGDVSSTRLVADWTELLKKLPQLGKVKAVTRSPDAVIECEGTYDNVEFFGMMGQSVSSIDLRIFVNRWRYGFAFREETRRGTSQGLAFFDASGRAVHKLFLRPETDRQAFDTLVREYTPADVVSPPVIEAEELSPPAKPDAEVDVAGLRKAWLEMTDTHEFFGLLRKFGVARTQALRLVGDDLSRPTSRTSLEDVLRAVAGKDLPIMVFVGNRGVIQIHSGAIHKVAPMGDWVNVLDPGFDLHVRTSGVASAWVVRKPTADGDVTSLELYTEDGEQLVHVVGKRHTGETENPTWREIVTSLPRPVA